MEIGFIGLGRMGMHMVERLLKAKHRVVVYNRSEDKVKEIAKKGAIGSKSIQELVQKLTQKQKIIWIMLPSGKVTEDAFTESLGLLRKDDILIEGANSNIHDTLRRHNIAAARGIGMLDAGVSGGLVGATKGYCMMIGGQKSTFTTCEPLFKSMCQPDGYAHMGDGGSGHYVKMVHNAIEYGMMQAIGEGFDLLERGRIKGLDLKNVAHVWNHGSIVSSFLMEMAEQALDKDPKLAQIQPYVDDTGEGRWAVNEALEYSIPFTVNSHALYARYTSRDKYGLSFRMLAALRNEFGGHAIKKK